MIHLLLHPHDSKTAISTKGTSFPRNSMSTKLMITDREILDMYRSICTEHGTQWDAHNKWDMLPIEVAMDFVRSLRYANILVDVSSELKIAYFEINNIEMERVTSIQKSLLFPYQKKDAVWLACRDRGLLASEMGTGKTPLVLMALPPSDVCRSIVVCPASIKSVWYDECQRWRSDLSPVILSGRNSFRFPECGEVVIINYEILQSDELSDVSFPLHLIADECHYLKNSSARRTKYFRTLSKSTIKANGNVWLVSGTPMMNNPLEMWNVLTAASLEKDAFDGWNTFKKLFKARKDEWNAWKFGDPDPSVPSRIRRVAIRRTRREVLPDLPAKMYRKVRVKINKATYGLCDSVLMEADAAGVDLEDAVSEAINTGARKVLFEEISEARRELATAKTPYATSLLDMYEEAGEPVVVFSAHLDPINIIKQREGWAVITGATKAEDRADIVRTFQEGKLSGLACTIAAGGVGITLTHAHQAVFIDMDWTPAMNLQAEDRLCRIGQTRGVVITRLIAEHPLDERLVSVLIRKQTLLEAANLN